jgi:hypothetical protein
MQLQDFGYWEAVARRLRVFAQEVFQPGFVLSLATSAGRVGQDTRGLGLADALAGVGLDGLGGRETGWLAFGHGWNEYGTNYYSLSALSSVVRMRTAGKKGPIHESIDRLH